MREPLLSKNNKSEDYKSNDFVIEARDIVDNKYNGGRLYRGLRALAKRAAHSGLWRRVKNIVHHSWHLVHRAVGMGHVASITTAALDPQVAPDPDSGHAEKHGKKLTLTNYDYFIFVSIFGFMLQRMIAVQKQHIEMVNCHQVISRSHQLQQRNEEYSRVKLHEHSLRKNGAPWLCSLRSLQYHGTLIESAVCTMLELIYMLIDSACFGGFVAISAHEIIALMKETFTDEHEPSAHNIGKSLSVTVTMFIAYGFFMILNNQSVSANKRQRFDYQLLDLLDLSSNIPSAAVTHKLRAQLSAVAEHYACLQVMFSSIEPSLLTPLPLSQMKQKLSVLRKELIKVEYNIEQNKLQRHQLAMQYDEVGDNPVQQTDLLCQITQLSEKMKEYADAKDELLVEFYQLTESVGLLEQTTYRFHSVFNQLKADSRRCNDHYALLYMINHNEPPAYPLIELVDGQTDEKEDSVLDSVSALKQKLGFG